MTVARAIDPSGSAKFFFTDSDGLNPRNSPPYTDGYVIQEFTSATAGQKLRVTEAGNVDVVVGSEASTTVAVVANDYAVIVGDGVSPGGESYALGITAAAGGSVTVTYAYVEPASVPSVTTQAATDLLSTKATLNGTLSDLSGFTGLFVYFQYGLSTGAVTDNTTTAQAVSATGAFSAAIAGLVPDSEYQFRAVVTDAAYGWHGDTLTFKTTEAGTIPVLDAIAYWGASWVNLLGNITDMGGYPSLSVYFEYGLTESFGATTTPETITAVNDIFLADPTGLTPDRQYHYRAVATDGTDFWYSATRSFYTSAADETGYEIDFGLASGGATRIVDVGMELSYAQLDLEECTLYRARVRRYEGGEYSDWTDWVEVRTLCFSSIEVVTEDCTDVGSDGATLNGDLAEMAGHASVNVYFRVMRRIGDGDTFALVTETPAQSVSAIGAFSAAVTGLERNTVYSVFAVAEAGTEIVVGDEVILVTEGMIVNTLNASSVGTATVTLNGELVSLDGEASLDVYFEYGRNFEHTTAPQTVSSLGMFSQALTGLDLRTEYVFRACATDGVDVWYGEAKTFQTTFDVIAKTFIPSAITRISATLEGSINMALASAEWFFQYGFSLSYGMTTALTAITTTAGSEAVSFDVSGLTEDKAYNCRLVVKDDSTVPATYYYGNNISFQTAVKKTVTSHTEALWRFDVNDTLHWSTRAAYFDGKNYFAAVIPSSFPGVESRVSLGTGLISSSDLTFDLYFNSSTSISHYLSILEGADLLISLVLGEGIDAVVEKKWRFVIERATFSYGVIRCHCKSLLQSRLAGYWPNSKNPQEIWPSSDPDIYTNYCVPVIFGAAYIPIKSVNTGEGIPPFDDRKYVLGPVGPTYVIEKIKAPRERGNREWSSGDYTFTQSSHNGYQLAQFQIDESVGPPYGNGIWTLGATMQIPFVKYTRSDTVDKTNPADWIEWILRDIGIKSSYLDTGPGSTFEIASQVFAARGLIWTGGYWEKRPIESTLSHLLAMCDAFLYESDKIELHVFSTSSHEFFDKTLERGFSVNPTLVPQSAGGGVEWPALDAPQDVFPGKTNINIDPFAAGVSNPSKQPFQYNFQHGTVIPQVAAILHHQKQHTKNRISFPSSVLDITNFSSLIPGKVVTLYNPKVFLLLKGIVLTSMRINYKCTIDFTAVELTQMNQWEDLSPDPVTIIQDETVGTMT